MPPRAARRAHRAAGRGHRLRSGRAGLRPAADPGRPRRRRLRARRPARRPAAVRHPGLQDAEGPHRPAARAAGRRGHRAAAPASTSAATVGSTRRAARRRRRGRARHRCAAAARAQMPGRALAGVHQAMDYLPQANRVRTGDLAPRRSTRPASRSSSSAAVTPRRTASARPTGRARSAYPARPQPAAARDPGLTREPVAAMAEDPPELAGARGGRRRVLGARGGRARRGRVRARPRRGRRGGADRPHRRAAGVPAGRRKSCRDRMRAAAARRGVRRHRARVAARPAGGGGRPERGTIAGRRRVGDHRDWCLLLRRCHPRSEPGRVGDRRGPGLRGGGGCGAERPPRLPAPVRAGGGRGRSDGFCRWRGR